MERKESVFPHGELVWNSDAGSFVIRAVRASPRGPFFIGAGLYIVACNEDPENTANADVRSGVRWDWGLGVYVLWMRHVCEYSLHILIIRFRLRVSNPYRSLNIPCCMGFVRI